MKNLTSFVYLRGISMHCRRTVGILHVLSFLHVYLASKHPLHILASISFLCSSLQLRTAVCVSQYLIVILLTQQKTLDTRIYFHGRLTCCEPGGFGALFCATEILLWLKLGQMMEIVDCQKISLSLLSFILSLTQQLSPCYL